MMETTVPSNPHENQCSRDHQESSTTTISSPPLSLDHHNNHQQVVVRSTTVNSILIVPSKHSNTKHYYPLLLASFFSLFVGSVSSCLLSKYYFIHGGSSIWVSTIVQSSGFPLLLLPVLLPYHLTKTTTRKPFTRFTPKILSLSVLIGLLIGLSNILFSWGNFYLPVSTSSLLLSTQLAFTLILSAVIVNQKITFSNLNCVFLLVSSSFLLALGSSHDKPEGLTKSKYFLGFASTVGAGLLFSLYLPVMERIYRHVYCYAMVVEMQLVMEAAATALALVAMAVGRGFGDAGREAAVFDAGGPGGYWAAVVGNMVTWQLSFVGTAGMIFMTTSLTGGICMTALVAMNVVGGLVVYGDPFGGIKAVSTALSVWGFCSYVYGMYVKMKKEKEHDHHQHHQHHHHQSNSSTQVCTEMVPMVIDRV